MFTATRQRTGSMTFAEVRRQLIEMRPTARNKRRVDDAIRALDEMERQYQSDLVEARQAGKIEGYGLGVDQATRVLQADAQTRIRLAEELALRDEETGLFRKTEFLDRIVPGFIRDVARDRRDFKEGHPELAALWYLDVDGLKIVNDTPGLGHDIGDYLIDVLSNLLKTNVRQEESISTRLTPDGQKERVVLGSSSGRIGGDEFLTLQIHLAHYIEALEVASRVKRGYLYHSWSDRHPMLGEFPYRPSVAIGVVVLRLSTLRGHKDKAEEIADQWRQKAEEAMYANKSQSDHRITIWGTEFDGEKLVDWPLEGAMKPIMSLSVPPGQ
jgi:GGDEF domain-containing protein